MLIQKCSLNTPKYFESDKTDHLSRFSDPDSEMIPAFTQIKLRTTLNPTQVKDDLNSLEKPVPLYYLIHASNLKQ